ncbi:probable F420-dependent oxidoreductase, MSMEG_2516 family [Actinopolyspora xinjiangensis]|uniref:Probable F420-dependent oxidoreductase, MSMEG_2516 family n=1 Tax=Actinopolyspora xinjiangensis TaxID=405564 RepID=A0A1H0W7A5_9ACTN|nr:probable F420-dependent oxidoreductase, MSMEG_2516 family [Actinopolyspora xinjiangensis]
MSVQATPDDAGTWARLARRCEDLGVRALLVADHPGVSASPFVSLAAAAGATSTLRLGSYVLNTGVRDPLLIASDVATLDVVSGGRAEVGLGAGHTPAEWEMIGRRRPSAAARVHRLRTTASAVRRLLDGATVPADDLGALRDVSLRDPRPVQRKVPLLVGGANPDLLRWGGAHADAVGLSGLGRTLSDGHSHTVSWSPQRVDAHIERVNQGARDAGTGPPLIEALVQRVVVTDDRYAAAAPLAERLDTPVEDLLAVPYLWIGTTDEILEQLRDARHRWGITRWVVREDSLGHAESVIERL